MWPAVLAAHRPLSRRRWTGVGALAIPLWPMWPARAHARRSAARFSWLRPGCHAPPSLALAAVMIRAAGLLSCTLTPVLDAPPD